MISTIKTYHILDEEYGSQLQMDESNKTIVFSRGKLVFVFNFHPTASIPDYAFQVPEPGNYKIILNSDSSVFGGHNRISEDLTYPARINHTSGFPELRIYNTNRTALVLVKE